MTDMRARYRGRCARTFAMVLSCCFLRCESLLNRAARRLGGFPSRHSRREATRTAAGGMGNSPHPCAHAARGPILMGLARRVFVATRRAAS